jgi:hypothetical protein
MDRWITVVGRRAPRRDLPLARVGGRNGRVDLATGSRIRLTAGAAVEAATAKSTIAHVLAEVFLLGRDLAAHLGVAV